MRVVIDTNILVSFAIRPNAAFERLFDTLAATTTILTSDDTVEELLAVLSRSKFPKYIPLHQSVAFVDWYSAISERIAVKTHVAACRDPNDNKFLALAADGKADYIIAGDRDLLEMIAFEGIPIYSPAAFIRLFIS